MQFNIKKVNIMNVLLIGALLLVMGGCDKSPENLSRYNKSFSLQWGLNNSGQPIKERQGIKGIDINILTAWRLTKGSSSILIGMLDSGIDINNLEIRKSIFVNQKDISQNGVDDDNNGYIDDVNGWNFYNNSNDVYDSYLHDYHGTYLSSIIAASHDVGEIYGIAPNIKILPLKFLQGTQGDTQDAICAVRYAYLMGVRIINCSWDCLIYNEKLKQIMEQYADVLFICSTGKNKADLNKTPVYPACYNLDNVISVAAVDNQGNLYEYSGYGNDADIAAPGVDVFSAMPEGDYTYSSGTSVAAAMVTGIAALVKSYNPKLSSGELAEILRTNVKSIPSLEGKILSGGIIDAYACLIASRNVNCRQ